jgi:PAS domain S-box-containing protein
MTTHVRGKDAPSRSVQDKSLLLNHEGYFRLLFENIKDYAIITLDLEGHIQSWNVGAEHLMQYKEREVLEKHGSIFFTEEDLAKGMPEKEIDEALKFGRAEDERWHVRKDGSRFWGSGLMIPIKKDDEFAGFIKIFRDRTHQRAHEKRKDDFVAIAGHELRTPLAILKMNIELLLLKMPTTRDKEVAEALKNMNEHVDRLAHLVTDLLDLSKIAAGKLVPVKKPLNLKKIIENEVQGHYQKISENHTIILLPSDDKEVMADKDLIIQVLYNLISNAIKYSPQADKVEVAVKAQKNGVKVTVRDYGIGIDKNERNKIFDRFYRVDNVKRQTTTGLGVGLFVCLEIVNAHQGTIGVESTVGKGSTFFFTIPEK